MFKTQIEAILSLDYHSKTYFQGCFAIDRLPQKRKARSSAYVINYDEHNKNGSHWIAVLSDEAGNVEFFDSSGQPPLDVRCKKFVGPNYSFSTVKLQQMFSNACGFHCIYYILHRSRNRSANDILHVLSSGKNSDFIVKDYIYSRYKPIFT